MAISTEKSVEPQSVPANKKLTLPLKPLSVDRVKELAWVFFRMVLIIGLSFIILYPIILKLSIAFKHKVDIYNPTVVFIPRTFTLENFQYVMDVMNYFKVVLNSFVLAGGTMILSTVACALAGYGFARFNFKGKNVLFGLVILTILVPPQTIMVPTYINYKTFDILGIIGLITGKEGINLIGTYWPFVISSITGMGLKAGLFIFIFRQFFRGFPKEIEEAAVVDGAGVFRTFFTIMLPNAIPAAITVMLFSFVWQWNDVFFTSMYLTGANVMSTQLQTVGATIANLVSTQNGGGVVDPFYLSMLVNTSVLLSIIPLLILYLFVQRHFVESVERTGIVG